MHGYHGPIEQLTLTNTNFRQVLYTGPHSQLVVMSLLPGEEIGQEIHQVDQFFRFERGQAKVTIDGQEQTVGDGDAIIVPAGAEHNVVNLSSSEPVKLYTIYAPANHKDGTIHRTKAEADRAEEHFDGQTTEH